MDDLLKHFSIIADPRIGNRKEHKLIDIIAIAITATICGADTWVDIEEFGIARKEWFESFLELKHGIPSHDTFNRVFSILSPEEFERLFRTWTEEIYQLTEGEVISIDGKTVRGSKGKHQRALHIVSAWANENGVSLGQVKTDKKSNEITAMYDLLDVLVIKGCIVTMDAMGCQKRIARKVIDQEADYVLALKSNQGNLHKDVELFFQEAINSQFEDIQHTSSKTVEKGHGRIETRTYYLAPADDYFNPNREWPELHSIGMVEAKRQVEGQISIQRRYYITSLPYSNINDFPRAVRQHWGIENKLHWVLDVAFREDEQRTRTGHGTENAALLRKMALNLLKQETTLKIGVRAKRLKAGWSCEYLQKVLRLASKM